MTAPPPIAVRVQLTETGIGAISHCLHFFGHDETSS